MFMFERWSKSSYQKFACWDLLDWGRPKVWPGPFIVGHDGSHVTEKGNAWLVVAPLVSKATMTGGLFWLKKVQRFPPGCSICFSQRFLSDRVTFPSICSLSPTNFLNVFFWKLTWKFAIFDWPAHTPKNGVTWAKRSTHFSTFLTDHVQQIAAPEQSFDLGPWLFSTTKSILLWKTIEFTPKFRIEFRPVHWPRVSWRWKFRLEEIRKNRMLFLEKMSSYWMYIIKDNFFLVHVPVQNPFRFVGPPLSGFFQFQNFSVQRHLALGDWTNSTRKI